MIKNNMTTEKKVTKKPTKKPTKKAIKKDEPKKFTFGRGFRIGLVATQAITSALFIFSLVSMHIVGGRDIFLFIAAFVSLLLLSAIKLLKSNPSKTANITCSVISVLCIVGSIVAFRYTDAFNAFLSKVTEQKPETKQYSVMVLGNSNISNVEYLKDKTVGFLKTDEKVANAVEKLQEKVKVGAEYYDDVDTMAGVLNGNITDAIVLESDRIEAFKEEAESLKNTTIIYTFEIELDAENKEIVEKDVAEEPFILYISGSDSRGGIKATARSDVNILAVVNPKQGKILLVSIPRDTYIQLHGTTGLKDKLTHAGIYGINKSKTTIEDFLGVKIDYTVKVSFDTVVKVVDQIDGIDVDSDKEMNLKVGSWSDKVCHYTVGVQHLDGDCALRFARERKSYPTGDRHRGENQQQVITSIISKLSSSRNYLLKLPSILDIAADSFETSLSRDDITSFIRMQLRDNTDWQVESITVNGAGSYQPTYSMGANRPLYVMITYPDSLNTAKTKIAEFLAL